KEGGNISQDQPYLLTNPYKSKISYGIENNASSMHGLRCAGSCSPHHCGGVLLACIPHPVEWQCSPSQNHRTSDNCLCVASPAHVFFTFSDRWFMSLTPVVVQAVLSVMEPSGWKRRQG